jgi:hypothetical protein
MMLVISVIVAVAILAVLLNLIPKPGFIDAKAEIKGLVTQMNSAGIGTESKEKVTFDKMSIEVAEVTAGLPIQAENVDFACCNNDPLCSKEGSPITVEDSGKTLIVHDSANGAVVVAKKQGTKFLVCLGSTDNFDQVSSACRTKVTNCKSGGAQCIC